MNDRIDKFGRVTLPSEMRSALGVREKDTIDFYLRNDGIFIKKHVENCTFCGSGESLRKIKGKSICNKCLQSANGIAVGEVFY